MNDLFQPFSQNSLAWLLTSSLIALISSFLTSWLYYHYIKRKEIIDSVVGEIENHRHKLALDIEESKRERIRQEIVRWANPILGTVEDLEYRLKNILQNGGYRALSNECDGMLNPNWSISYSYYMNSTLYLFGQYFAWIQMLNKELNFEIFQSQNEKDEFFKAIYKVSDSLGKFPANVPCSGKDTQVFKLQQRTIGEIMIDPENNQPRCMNYSDFLVKLNETSFREHFEALGYLIEDLHPLQECRWKRLIDTLSSLIELKECCKNILKLTI